MIGRIFAVLTLGTFVELFLLLKLTQVTSFTTTVVMVLVTAGLGSWLIRREGGKAIRRVQTELGQGRVPAEALLDGFCIAVAGAFLITPGVLTDSIGLLLLFPPSRALMRAYLVRRFTRSIATGSVRVMGPTGSGFAGFSAGGGFGGFAGGFGDDRTFVDPGPEPVARRVGPGPSGVVIDGTVDGDAQGGSGR